MYALTRSMAVLAASVQSATRASSLNCMATMVVWRIRNDVYSALVIVGNHEGMRAERASWMLYMPPLTDTRHGQCLIGGERIALFGTGLFLDG